MLKMLKKLSWKEWIMVAISVIFIAGQVWLDLKLPEFMSEITTLLTTGSSDMGAIWRNGGFMLACAIGSALLSVVVGFFAARIAAKLGLVLRANIYSQIQDFSKSEMKQFSTASLITRSTNDVTQVQNFVAMGLQVMVKAPIMAVWAIIKIVGKSWQWSLITAVAVAVLLLCIITILLFCLPRFKKMQKQTDDINRVARENLTGLRVVKAFNAEKFEEDKFEEKNSNLTDTNMYVYKRMSLFGPMMSLVMNGVSLAIYWVGAYIIQAASGMEKITLFSDMVVFMSYAVQVIFSFIMLVMIFMMLPRATVSAKRINEILDTKSSIKDGQGAAPVERGTVEFKNVSFKYPNADEYVLKNISFKVNKGEQVAFIGSTGSGKSTLIDLVPRFYDATEGEVLIDGINVKDYKLEELYNILGYVSQKSILFTGTINENVGFGKNKNGKPSEEEIQLAIKQAQAKDFVEKMPDKYNSHISQGGKNVSGGQKQRLSIARALARKSEILIFDDSFSALDYKTDKALRKTLNKDLKGTTSLIVAQRIGTIKNADQIIVLDNGNMVGKGKHEELLKNCPIYKEIALSQLSKEEL
ncbi:MAG: ABC transporter ATP-binding protein/permease [Firmicutes bacterium]|nr:ABC transporter ATP-binding protein/permease [Bacillota bacterium]